MNSLLQDLRYALRQLRKSPGFAITAVATLALALGATTAVFSVMYATLIRPLPFEQPERIAYLQPYSPQGYTQPASYPEYKEWRSQNSVFSAIAGYSIGTGNLEGPNGPTPMHATYTTDRFFEVFGVRPVIGRTFATDEDAFGKAKTAVLSYAVWQRDFGGRNDVIGNTLKLDGEVYTIVGVMPAGFRYPISRPDGIYVPLQVPLKAQEARASHWLPLVARLKNSVSFKQAQADLDRVLSNEAQRFPEVQGRRMQVLELPTAVVGNTRMALNILLLAVAAVLLIGCVNLSALLLARWLKRSRELALRSAIGATRVRIVRQAFTETALLGCLGAIAGVALAWLLLRCIRLLLVSALARGADVQINIPVLLTASAIGLLSACAAGLWPALHLSAMAPSMALKSGGAAGQSRREHRVRTGFIVAQVALAMALLAASGTLLHALSALWNTPLGFAPDRILTEEINLSPPTYQGRDVLSDFYTPMLARVRGLPGVTDAGVISNLPVQTWGNNGDVQIIGHPPAPKNQEQLAETRAASPGYFRAMDLHLLRGRMFDDNLDTPKSEPVTVVNQRFVQRFFDSGEDPIGKYVTFAGSSAPQKWRIVGVVTSVRQNLFSPPLAEMDFSISQTPVEQRVSWLANMQLVLRSERDPKSVVPDLRRSLHEIDASLPFRPALTMSDVIAETLTFQRLQNWLFGVFAVLALALALVGIYGGISHEVELTTRDIGVKLALGATRWIVLSSVFQRVATMLVAGTIVGMLVAAASQRILRSMLSTTAERDFPVLVGLAAALIAAGMLSAFPPARRAATVDPVQAIRYE